MKKIVSLLVVLVMVSSFAISYADIDISGLSYEELVALKDKINLAIWNSKEWKEVEVPQGDWIVGEDIPAGKWTVKCAKKDTSSSVMSECDMEWGFYDKENQFLNCYGDGGGYVNLYNPENRNYDEGKVTEYTIELVEGMMVRIKPSYAPAIFTPYAGKPSLGF